MKSALILVLLPIIFSCNRFGKKEKKKEGKDRVVCCSQQLTEFMFALGQGDKIVGIDLTSTYPPETKKLTTVGYHHHLSAEGIISLDPTLVIQQGDVAPPTVMPQLEQVGIPVKQYPHGSTIDSAKIVLKMVAHDYGADSIANRLIKAMDADLEKADSIVKKYPTKPRVRIIHFGQQRNQYFVMGTRGTANAMITLAGGINAADTSSFRDLSAEVIARAQPDVILATDFGFDPAIAFADRTIFMKDGKIPFDFSDINLVNSEVIREVFDISSSIIYSKGQKPVIIF